MKARRKFGWSHVVMVMAVMMLGASLTWAADKPPASPPAPSKEMREKMAQLHEKMATCLRSDKAFPECMKEMRENCSSMMGQDGCPMMGMGMGPGMRGGGPMQKGPPATEKK